MIPDPTDEIREIRRKLAAEFGNDLHRIAEETRRRQRESGREYITLPRRTPRRDRTTSQVMHSSGNGSDLENGGSSPAE